MSVPADLGSRRLAATPIARRRPFTSRVVGAAAAAFLALTLVGCTAPFSSDSAQPMPAPEMTIPGVPLETLPGDAAAGREAGRAEASDRSVVTTGQVSITVADPVGAADDVADLASAAGGRVDARSETPGTDTQPASAQLVIRVPADDLESVIDDLRELGSVTSVSLNASDVTQQRQDLDARIDALTTSVDRLTELLAQATSTADLVAIESELTTRQAELDSLTQQRDWLVDQVDFSTLTVDLRTEATAPNAGPDTFWGGIIAGWHALWSFLSGLVIALGVVLPWLIALALVGGLVVLVVWLATRSARRRRSHPAVAAEDAPARAPEPAGEPRP